MSADIVHFSSIPAATRALAMERMAELHAAAFQPAWNVAELASLVDHPGAITVFAAASAATAATAFALARVAADEAEVLTIVTGSESRRTGLARRLLRTMQAEAARRGASRMFLEVAEDNTPARRLYDSEGYRETGRRRGYYQRPGTSSVDALVLVKPLGSTLSDRLDAHGRSPPQTL